MSDRCIFCSKELNWSQKKKLFCGVSNQILCPDCLEKYQPLGSFQRAEAALKTGRASNAENLRNYVENLRSTQRQKEEAEKAREQTPAPQLECLRCHSMMRHHGPVTFKLGEEHYFFSDIQCLMSGSLPMSVYRCPTCGKTEFFIPDAALLEDAVENSDI